MYKKILKAINERIKTLDSFEENDIIYILDEYEDDGERAEQISEMLGVDYTTIYTIFLLTV